MRRAARAERILELVLPRERAAALIGDLLEQTESPRAFWFAMGRTFAACLWRSFLDAPFHLLAVAILGWGAAWGLYAGCESLGMPGFWIGLLTGPVSVLTIFAGAWREPGRAPALWLLLMLVWGVLNAATGAGPHTVGDVGIVAVVVLTRRPPDKKPTPG